MRILHISKYYHPFLGGIEKVIKDLSEGTVKAGHEVTVLSSSEDNIRREDTVNGVKVVRLPRLGVVYSQPLTMTLFWEMKKYLAWADVVHVHTPNPLAEFAFLLNNPKIPSVATYHCDVVRQRKLMMVYRPIAQRLLRRMDRVIVATPKHLEYSEPLQPVLSKCDVVPFGLQGKFSKRTMGMTHKMKDIKDKFGDYFLFIGRLVPYKGVDVLLRALVHTDKKLVCIGVGPRWDIWRNLAQELGVSDRVHFLGRVDDDELFAAYIHGCQSVVLPSIDESEAFGIVLIEAMACGKPVITTQLKSGVSWVNQAGVTGIEVQPREWEPLAQAMNIMASNHEMRNQMGAAAFKRFEQTFQLSDMIAGYENIYFDVVDRKKVAA